VNYASLGRAVPGTGRDQQAGLTRSDSPRELEVMEHLAAGKTNREVTDGLFLSVRTVDPHVARILDKLGMRSRAAASSRYERARAEGLRRPHQVRVRAARCLTPAPVRRAGRSCR
jgi:DNA-binding NarL/FixJ family response regulator